MALFKINNSKVKKITTKKLAFEKELQVLFENNLEELLDITFLAHEYSTSFGGRIDTLGIDHDGSPCIIEYKKIQNDNVINQGLSYLRWLLDHKADFEILCRENNIDIKIDWDSPRVICVAQSYNKFDSDTAELLPIKIELYRYQIYNDNILHLERNASQQIKVSTNNIIQKSKKEKSRNLQKTYTINDHLAGVNKNIIDLFYTIREKIISLDEDIIEEAKSKYIAYKIPRNFVDLVIKQSGIRVYLNLKSGQLDDPKNMAQDLVYPKKIGHWGNGDYRVRLKDEKDLNYIFSLIKQSYDFNK